MNIRFAIFAVTLSLGMGAYSRMAWGQGKPQDKRTSETAELQESGDWKGPTRQRMNELQGKFQEYREGKRDYRDAYIILENIHHMYGVIREQHSPEAQKIIREQKKLLQEHPELLKLKDFRLSDEIVAQQREKQEEKRRKEMAEAATPKDDIVGNIFGSNQGRYAVAEFQYRLEFFSLPDGVFLKQVGDTSQFRPFRDDREISLSGLRRTKVMSFRYPYHLAPLFPRKDEVTINFLVCTALLAGYVPKTVEEEKVLKPRMTSNAVPWVNRAAQHEHFCGVVSPGGEIVYDFRFRPRIPDRLIRPLFMSDDGKYAVLMIGERIYDGGNPDNKAFVGKPREVWLWEHPQKLTKKKVDDPSMNPGQLREMYRK